MKIYHDYPDDKQTLVSYKPRESEKEILDFWAEFESKPSASEEYWQPQNEGPLSFAWGPPYPTGSPHAGHVLNAVLKDVFLRYGQQKYVNVQSKFYWDCHGLPVEHEVDRKLGIASPEEIEKMGISAYNEECRKYLSRHEAEWKNVFKRIGARVDFDHTYSTMTAESMERFWGAFKQLFDKGMVYRDTKVLPFSTGCFTHLSDLEAEQKSRNITELGATIAVDIAESVDKLLIWMVGPWKLVAATAICVNPNARYVKVKVISSGEVYIVSKNRLRFTFPNTSEYTPIVEFGGRLLHNLRCHRLSEFSQGNDATFMQILMHESIPDDVGTGIVALSPYFDEAGYRICKENGVDVDESLCPVDKSGRFKECIPGLGGLSISEAGTSIVESLQRRGCLFYVENIKHKQRFCWRSGTPLMDKLVSSWFLRTQDLREQILENSAKVNWIFKDAQGQVKESLKAFQRDWAIGRSRFWGTPIPIWSSPSGDEVVCVGSIKELLDLTGLSSISDLHREFVDNLEIKSKVPGNPPLRRVTEVFDCWFEASVFPREDERLQFDTMIEGSDQFNGWFLTTIALSTALNLPPLSKDVYVHGLVETSKGEKLSKRKHNHNDPLHIVEKYGADTLRLYLLTTPLVSGGNIALQEQDVPHTASRIFSLLYEIVKDIYPRFGKAGWVSYGMLNEPTYIGNIFDRWVMSRTERLIQLYDSEMTAFRPHTLIPQFIEHLESILSIYMPIRRREANQKQTAKDSITFLLYCIVFKFLVMLSPFAPFFTEHVYQLLKPWVSTYKRELMYKVPLFEKSESLISKEVEEKVDCWRTVVELVRELRRVHIIPIQYRISELVLISPTEVNFKDEELLNTTLLDVVNVHRVTYSNDRRDFGVELSADLKEASSLHSKLSAADVERVSSTIQQLTDDEVAKLIEDKSLSVDDEEIPFEDIQISCKFNKELDKNQTMSSRNEVAVVIRMNKDLDYYEEGTRLELVNSVIKFRKKCKVFLSEEATVYYSTKDECMRHAFEKYADHLKESTNSVVKPLDEGKKSKEETIQMEVHIKGVPVDLSLHKETAVVSDEM